MRKLALVWVIIAAIIATVTTVLQIEPAATIIEAASDSRGSFFIVIPVGIIFLICVLPLLFIMLINNLIQNRKNKIPQSFTGKTGIVVKRAKELTNAALMYEVLIDGQQRSKVGMGKSVFVELAAGSYTLQTKLGNKIHSAEIPVLLEEGKVVAYETKTDISKSLTTIVPKGEMLFLVQVPFTPH